MEFSFSAERWLTAGEIASGETFDRDFALGLHAPGSFARVLDLHECHLQSPLFPVVPILFLLLTAGLTLSTIVEDPTTALYGFLVVAAGVPALSTVMPGAT